ncbi:MAG: hypothetical protein ABI053_02550 [Lacisediminihabitans sp.]
MSDPVTPAPNPVPASVPAPLTPARKLRWITPTLAIVAALAIGIAGGVLIGRSGASANQGNLARGQFASGQGTGTGQQGGGGFAGGGFTSGTIVTIDGTTITVKAQDGTQKTVTTSGDTKVTKTSASSVDALKKGETITVIGATGSDGSVTATTISEGAGLRGGFGRGSAGGTATPPASTGN